MLAQLTRTAVYGPVRTVVWQGSAGDRRPYADQSPIYLTLVIKGCSFLERFEQRTRNVLQRGAFYNVFVPVRTWDVIPFDQTWRAVVAYNARSAARNMLLALGIQSGGYPC